MRNEKQNIINVIARVGIGSWLPVNFHDPKQSPAMEHEVCQPQRFVRFISYLGGLLRAVEIGGKPQDHASPRNDGRGADGLVWRLFLAFTIFHLSSSISHAQSPYTGGPGDGHAMGELVLRPVSVGELATTNGYAVYPSLAKPNETIYITCPVAGEFMLVDLTGRNVINQNLAQPVKQFPIIVTQAGSYIGILRTAEGIFTQKIIVIE